MGGWRKAEGRAAWLNTGAALAKIGRNSGAFPGFKLNVVVTELDEMRGKLAAGCALSR